MYNNSLKNIQEIKSYFPNEQVCIYHLEKLRWNGQPVSPFDKDSKVYVCKKNNYRCKNTGKYFNVKTGTLFGNTKLPLQKWFIAIWMITNNNNKIITKEILARELDITLRTATVLLKKIKLCFYNE